MYYIMMRPRCIRRHIAFFGTSGSGNVDSGVVVAEVTLVMSILTAVHFSLSATISLIYIIEHLKMPIPNVSRDINRILCVITKLKRRTLHPAVSEC
jgi:hypothetical protein